MNSKISPAQYMLMSYKNTLGPIYQSSFNSKDEDIKLIRLIAFSKSLISYMQRKGFDYRYVLNKDSVDILNNHTLLVSYQIKLIDSIKNESSLQFQLFSEWGTLMSLSEKEQALLAL